MGSESWRGVADALVECTRSNGKYFLRSEFRGESGWPRMVVNVDLETGEIAAAEAGAMEAQEATAAISDFVANQAAPVDAAMIRAGVGLTARVVGGALKAGREAGLWTCTGTGRRGDPFLYSPRFDSCFSATTTGNGRIETGNVQSALLPVGDIRFPTSGNRIQKNAASGIESAPSVGDENPSKSIACESQESQESQERNPTRQASPEPSTPCPHGAAPYILIPPAGNAGKATPSPRRASEGSFTAGLGAERPQETLFKNASATRGLMPPVSCGDSEANAPASSRPCPHGADRSLCSECSIDTIASRDAAAEEDRF